MDNKYLIEVKNLKKYFPVKSSFGKTTFYKAVDDISFGIKSGETLGLVGESGCGKTTAGRTIIRLYTQTSGQVFYNGEEITDKNISVCRRKMQMVFQDPYSSLDPRMTIENIIGEPLDVHKLYKSKGERHDRVQELMETVGINPAYSTRYAHEFSGGQRQRIGIARALAVNPDFIICDEPVSALDVSIQAQIINMFEDLQKKLGVTYLFIAHDLPVVHHISDRIAVMYLGRIMEIGGSDDIFANPLNPYTQSLLDAIPVPDPSVKKLAERKNDVLSDTVSSAPSDAEGCPFASRCKYAKDICRAERPELTERADGHLSACHIK